ncbi:MAG: hypothetical protein RDV48_09325 [Candidatus Eremiobacteraeota bacterium]|nr:hypothetical protein [Candidatus Eremiobacteraeota bacterium]
MDPIDPASLQAKPGGMAPLTEEFYLQQKKQLKQAKMETTAPMDAHDVFSLSPEAATQLPKDKFESFLETAKNNILKMDPNSKNFLPDATSRLVSSALEQEFGEGIIQNPGYPQMKAKLTKRILSDPKYRDIMEEFLTLLNLSEQSSNR